MLSQANRGFGQPKIWSGQASLCCFPTSSSTAPSVIKCLSALVQQSSRAANARPTVPPPNSI